MQANHKVADLKLADAGRLKVEWAESRMPVLMALREKFKTEKPFGQIPPDLATVFTLPAGDASSAASSVSTTCRW